jgi:hypothetical protein
MRSDPTWVTYGPVRQTPDHSAPTAAVALIVPALACSYRVEVGPPAGRPPARTARRRAKPPRRRRKLQTGS